jgi:hypothetical protein
MKLYLCYVYTPQDDTPRMLTLTCDNPADIPRAVEDVAVQWPLRTAVDVFDDDRRVWSWETPHRPEAAND